ncbi:MAG: hypothetical protein AB1342_03445 [Pseudomonadota bacterium]
MLKTIKRILADVRLVRMSDGHLALVRDLGLVKGGRGLRQHEKLMSFGSQLVSIPARIRIARARDLLAKDVSPSLSR